ncbi:DUF1617 family protein [Streptococcus acidominimus]|nr:DUF1617 family protein [Streptococcus acidominimus]
MKANRGRAKLSAHAASKLNEYLQDETEILERICCSDRERHV